MSLFVFVPGVQIPTLTVMRNALGRNCALAMLVATPAEVLNAQLLALQSGTGGRLKCRPHGSGGHRRKAQSVGSFTQIQTAVAHQLVEAVCKRTEVLFEQPTTQVLQQPL